MKKTIFLTLLSCSWALAQNTSCTTPSQDAALGYHDGYGTNNNNYGTDPYMKAFCISGAQGWGMNANRSVLQFDVSSIPSSANLISANLFLSGTGYLNSTLPGHFGNNASYLRKINTSWDQYTVTWNSQPPVSTIDEVLLTTSSSFDQDYTLNLNNIASQWISNPQQNNGLLFQLDTENPSSPAAMLFYSSNYQDSTKWPKLCIEYAQPNNYDWCRKPSQDAGLGYHYGYPAQYTNYVNDIYMKAYCIPGAQGGANSNRSVLQFDLSSIPFNAQVLSTQLNLTATGYISSLLPGHFGNNLAYLRKITNSWDASNVTWDTQPSTTTLDQLTLNTSSSSTQNYSLSLDNIVADWIGNASQNYGLLFQLDVEDPNSPAGMLFYSSNYQDSTKWPSLCVEYKSGETVIQTEIYPTPSVLLYPNPSSEFLFCEFPKIPKKGHFHIYNTEGKLLKSGIIKEEKVAQIDIQDLCSGSYSIQISTEDYVKNLFFTVN